MEKEKLEGEKVTEKRIVTEGPFCPLCGGFTPTEGCPDCGSPTIFGILYKNGDFEWRKNA